LTIVDGTVTRQGDFDFPLLPTPTPEDATGEGELATVIETMWADPDADEE
jgi:hypothetical protein